MSPDPEFEFGIVRPGFDGRRHFGGRVRTLPLNVRNAEGGLGKGRPEALILLRIPGCGFVGWKGGASPHTPMNSNLGKGTQGCLVFVPERTARACRVGSQEAQNRRDFLRRDAFCKVERSDLVCRQSLGESRQQGMFEPGGYASESAGQTNDRPDFHDQVRSR